MNNYLKTFEELQYIDLYENALLEGLEDLKKHYPKVKEEDFMRIVELDPTYKKGSDKAGKYTKWLLTLASRNNGLVPDEGHLKDVLTRFDSEKNKLKEKDIFKFKSAQEVDDYLNNYENYKDESARQKLRQVQKKVHSAELDEEADKVFEDEDWEVWVPKTYEASCKLGRGTSWCTATTEDDYYYRMYSSQGPLYININKKNGSKYQFHFESNQYMDENDRPIGLPESLEKNPSLRDFYYKVISKKLFGEEKGPDDEVEVTLDEGDIGYMFDNLSKGGRNAISGETAAGLIFDPVEEIMSWGYDGLFDILSGDISFPHKLPKTDAFLETLGLSVSRVEEILKSSDHELHDIMKEAYIAAKEQAYIQGTAQDAHKDAVAAFVSCLADEFTNCSFDGEKFVIQSKVVDFINEYLFYDSEYNGLFDDILTDIIGGIVTSSYVCYEPQYGWDGFDDEVFDSAFVDSLSDSIESMK